jgi:hypothetical protein
MVKILRTFMLKHPEITKGRLVRFATELKLCSSAELAWEPTAPMITVDKLNWQIGQQLVRLLVDRAEGRLPDEPQWQLVPPKILETKVDAATAPVLSEKSELS